ncbi:MAG: exodeoxyribonuclease VII small subunit [Bacteroidota bacterium]|nr:exodeoxyribonuclease VII small subunit [Candidatus Kapabacteria bacterium]MDW8221191.1 exodeoxyribonuclease VII small subunit [Bacteroidota bacterium]
MQQEQHLTLPFEERLARLEEIVALLDKSDLPLSELLVLYEEGMDIVQQCRAFLQSAEQRIWKLQNGMLVQTTKEILHAP